MIPGRLSRAKRSSCHHSFWRSRVFFSSLSDYLHFDPSVEEAIKNGEPVVALESTIVAHGMPFPQNLQTAQSVESIVRRKGATPATIAVRNNTCCIGISSPELEDLAKAGEENRAQKCSTRELSLILAKNIILGEIDQRPIQWGATTVASTMTLAHAAGISSFVTGGVGGVHREGELSMDVSADLTELSRTPVVVISAGIKSILDIPRTLEVLETNSVPTVAYQTDEFPCFFSPNSGITSPARVDSAAEVASAYWAARALNLRHGMLVAVPPPDPAGESIEKAIQTALKEASERGLQGQAVTPFILKHVANSTKGASLSCNISLVKNNANVGTEIAMAIAEGQSATSVGVVANEYPRASQVIVMGGTVLDIVAKPTANTLLLGTSNPAECRESDGGVSRNIAEVLGRLGSEPLLFSAVGDDARGLAIQRRQAEYGIKNSHLTINVVKGANTATYLAVLEGETNDLHTACADMAVMSDIKAPTDTQLRQADTLVLDANPPLKILEETAEAATKLGVAVFFEPTSVPKAQQVASSPSFLRCVTAAFPNLDELIAMRDAARSATRREGSMPMDMDEIRSTSAQLLDHMAPERAYLVVTLGSQGVLLAARGASKADYQFRHFPVTEEVVVENCTGAGDTLCGAFIHAIRQGENLEEAVLLGMQAATVSLRSSSRTIAPALSELKPSI